MSAPKKLDKDAVKAAARGRWLEIVPALTGIDPSILDGHHHPCPKCGGKDRFRAFDDFAETGGVICQPCRLEPFADGLATIEWFLGIEFPKVVAKVGDHLGLSANRNGSNGAPRVVARYNYLDENGAVVLQVLRLVPKTFRQRRPDGKGGWINSTKGARQVPYNLPTILSAPRRPVVVVEGEKDADNLAKIDVLATCNAMGAGKWTDEHSAFFAGRHMIIVPDKDEPGRKHANQVAGSLHKYGATIRIVELPGDGKDASDWIDAGGTKDELKKLIIATPIWKDGGNEQETEPTESRPADPEPPRYEPFPVDLLPDIPRRYIVSHAAAMLCDEAMIALPLLAALGACVGNTRVVHIKSSWTEPCIFWHVVVADSGSQKTPAWVSGIAPLQRRDDAEFRRFSREYESYKKIREEYELDLAEWKKKGRKRGDPRPEEPAEPVCNQLVYNDCTIEAILVSLASNPRGGLLARDELSGWLSSFDAYKQSRGADAAHWLSMHSARSINVNRKTGIKHVSVPRAAVGIAGTIQPDILKISIGGRHSDETADEKSIKEHMSNGLVARMVFAFPTPRPKVWTEDEVSAAIIDDMDRLASRLLALDFAPSPDDDEGLLEPIRMRLTPDAKAEWVRFYNAHNKEQVELSRDLASAWSKLEGCAARYAMLIQLLTDPDSLSIDLPAMVSGIGLSRWFGNEASRIYSVIGCAAETAETVEQRERSRLLDWIKSKGGSVTARDLQSLRRFRGNTEQGEIALQDLVDAGQGSWEVDTHDGGKGRPVRRFVASGDTTSKNTEKNGFVFPSPPSDECRNQSVDDTILLYSNTSVVVDNQKSNPTRETTQIHQSNSISPEAGYGNTNRENSQETVVVSPATSGNGRFEAFLQPPDEYCDQDEVTL